MALQMVRLNWQAEPIDNFTLDEARCHGAEGNMEHDCGLVILVPELLEALANVRRDFGKPIKVKSWTRCRPHNEAVGGVKRSYHVNGRAVDIAALNVGDRYELEAIARQYFEFVKRYGWGLHCDVRGERA